MPIRDVVAVGMGWKNAPSELNPGIFGSFVVGWVSIIASFLIKFRSYRLSRRKDVLPYPPL